MLVYSNLSINRDKCNYAQYHVNINLLEWILENTKNLVSEL